MAIMNHIIKIYHPKIVLNHVLWSPSSISFADLTDSTASCGELLPIPSSALFNWKATCGTLGYDAVGMRCVSSVSVYDDSGLELEGQNRLHCGAGWETVHETKLLGGVDWEVNEAHLWEIPWAVQMCLATTNFRQNKPSPSVALLLCRRLNLHLSLSKVMEFCFQLRHNPVILSSWDWISLA